MSNPGNAFTKTRPGAPAFRGYFPFFRTITFFFAAAARTGGAGGAGGLDASVLPGGGGGVGRPSTFVPVPPLAGGAGGRGGAAAGRTVGRTVGRSRLDWVTRPGST